jgi:anthranilate phosphoribosyltransferase
MLFSQYIKELSPGLNGPRDLSEDDAKHLFGAMLDGGIPDLELGSLLTGLRAKKESVSELTGFYRAVDERLIRLRPPSTTIRTVVIPTYNGAREQANLLPLLVLLLRRLGLPVLIHGCLDGNGRIASAYILRELGILPCITPIQAQHNLDNDGLAFIPTAVISPGLASLLSLRGRLGTRNSAHTMVKLIDPFKGEGLKLVSASNPIYLERIGQFLTNTHSRALLMQATEGEPFANPKRRPKIVHYQDGMDTVLFDAEIGEPRHQASQPESIQAAATAHWIKRVMAGEVPVPHPIAKQFAACLFACGYSEDLNRVKAIAAVEAASLMS